MNQARSRELLQHAVEEGFLSPAQFGACLDSGLDPIKFAISEGMICRSTLEGIALTLYLRREAREISRRIEDVTVQPR